MRLINNPHIKIKKGRRLVGWATEYSVIKSTGLELDIMLLPKLYLPQESILDLISGKSYAEAMKGATVKVSDVIDPTPFSFLHARLDLWRNSSMAVHAVALALLPDKLVGKELTGLEGFGRALSESAEALRERHWA